MNPDLDLISKIQERLLASESRERHLRQALEWYAEKVKDCRRTTSEGEVARRELDQDGGRRASDALNGTLMDALKTSSSVALEMEEETPSAAELVSKIDQILFEVSSKDEVKEEPKDDDA